MHEPWLQDLHEWHEFYFLIGTAAAALTGLMFVVVSIGPGVIAKRSKAGVRAFVTPVMVHLTSVLIASSLMIVPIMTPAALAILLGAGSIGMLGYIFAIGVQRQWREGKLDMEDWFGYVALPILSYVVLLAAAVAIWLEAGSCFAIVAAATLLLLIVSIHNAWDLVLWMAQQSHEA